VGYAIADRIEADDKGSGSGDGDGGEGKVGLLSLLVSGEKALQAEGTNLLALVFISWIEVVMIVMVVMVVMIVMVVIQNFPAEI